MELNEYQQLSRKTAIYPKINKGFEYSAMGLAGEIGEILNILKKVHRDNLDLNTLKPKLKDELGDALWYVASLAHDLGFTLNDIGVNNIIKLNARYEHDKRVKRE